MTNNVAGKKRRSRQPDPVKDKIPTPTWVINEMAKLAEYKPGQSILDPCAGDGVMVRYFIENYSANRGDCLEIEPAPDISLNLYSNLIIDDFFNAIPELEAREFDLIVMNPPFSNLGVERFIRRALPLLSNDGKLITITPLYILEQNWVRRKFLNGHICKYVGLPTNAFQPYCEALHTAIIELGHKPSGYISFAHPPENQLDLSFND
jgi:phospholipid N-methyltransferase